MTVEVMSETGRPLLNASLLANLTLGFATDALSGKIVSTGPYADVLLSLVGLKFCANCLGSLNTIDVWYYDSCDGVDKASVNASQSLTAFVQEGNLRNFSGTV